MCQNSIFLPFFHAISSTFPPFYYCRSSTFPPFFPAATVLFLLFSLQKQYFSSCFPSRSNRYLLFLHFSLRQHTFSAFPPAVRQLFLLFPCNNSTFPPILPALRLSFSSPEWMPFSPLSGCPFLFCLLVLFLLYLVCCPSLSGCPFLFSLFSYSSSFWLSFSFFCVVVLFFFPFPQVEIPLLFPSLKFLWKSGQK